MRFTDKTIGPDKPALPAGKTDKIFFDDRLHGFGLRVREGAKIKVWIYQYSLNNKTQRMTIGTWPAMTAAEAYQRVRKLTVQRYAGNNPAKYANLEQHIAEKFSRFAALGTEPKCYLYRQYGPTGDLLYVGVSLEPLRRQMAHFKIANWRAAIFRIVIEPFETREAALAAEREAIREEYPKFNATHNGQRHAIAEITSATITQLATKPGDVEAAS
jgi:hypothetical protein